MGARGEKTKVDAENRSAKYLFTEVGGQAVRLVCAEQIAEFMDDSLNRHEEKMLKW